MDKELENLLDNYENVIYEQAFPISPSIHQLHLLLDYIANLDQQCKKQQEINQKAIEYIKEKQKIQYKFALSHIECDDLLEILEDKEVSE